MLEQIRQVVAQISAAVDVLLGADMALLDGAGLIEVVQLLEVQRRRLDAVDARLIAELDTRNVASDYACSRTSDLLRQALRIDPSAAKRRVSAARDWGPRRALSGELLEPVFPTVAHVLAEGAIAAEHAHVVTAMIDELPAAVAAEQDRSVEAFLIGEARTVDPRTLRRIALELSQRLNPDGAEYTEADQARRRDFTMHRHPDGSSTGRFMLTPLATEAVCTVLDVLAKPRPEQDGMKDPRRPGQRRHDAIEDAMRMVLRSGRLPDCGGMPATILITMTAEEAARGAGLATTGHGGRIPTRTALTLAGEAQVQVVVRGLKGIEGYSSTQQLFTTQQRYAMVTRDGGCSFPGCTVPAAWCQTHHIEDFAHGGPTSVANGTLLCPYHHRYFAQRGWVCRMIDGTACWIPPAWIDRNQVPRRNTAHRPDLAANAFALGGESPDRAPP